VTEKIMGEDRSIIDVLHDIGGNLQDIVYSEIRHAKTEVREELHTVRGSFAAIAAPLLASVFAAFFLLLSVVYALAVVMPNWLAAFCVASLLVLVVVVTLIIGRRRMHNQSVTHKTIAPVEEKLKWAKQQIK
jgi:uncharacterized membrane protein YqjE